MVERRHRRWRSSWVLLGLVLVVFPTASGADRSAVGTNRIMGTGATEATASALAPASSPPPGDGPAHFAIPHVAAATTPVPSASPPSTHLAPLSQSDPHTQPTHPIGGLKAHDVTNGSLNLSTNWSGLVETGGSAVFSGVQGDWVVPAVHSSATDEASATWIGIDDQSSQLIQTGVAQNSGPDYGGTEYYAWVEMLPAAPGIIEISSNPAPVVPGDLITSSITEVSPGMWSVDIADSTQGWTFSQPFSYSTPGLTAEWIEEAPTVSGSISPLANYGSATFTNLGITGTGLSSAVGYPLYLATASGAIVSYPANFNSSTNSFSLFYGSPSPQVTSVSPNQGSTSGGTSVTIGGNFVTGVTAVDVAGIAVPFTADVAQGTVTATTPPHSAGAVDINVTTPGGTSQTSTADQFTYVIPPPPPPTTTTTTPVPTVTHGYWLVGSDGGIFSFGSAQFYGSTGSLRLQRPVVGIVPTADRGGYWLDASDGGVFAFGDSGFYGSIPGLGLHPAGSHLANSLNAPIVGMVPSADGAGYFMVGSDGGVFAFGDARFAGSCPGIGGCLGTAVAVMPDASGNGYWLVTSLGYVYAFGDASNYGQPGQQSVPVTSAVRTPDGKGYWILFANGAISHYGDAGFFGSPVGQFGGLNPANAIFSSVDGGGYWVASAGGSVDGYGDAPNDGSMANTALNGSIVAATGW